MYTKNGADVLLIHFNWNRRNRSVRVNRVINLVPYGSAVVEALKRNYLEGWKRALNDSTKKNVLIHLIFALVLDIVSFVSLWLAAVWRMYWLHLNIWNSPFTQIVGYISSLASGETSSGTNRMDSLSEKADFYRSMMRYLFY